ncbi:hypothetical protein LAZ67_2001091 [Cordylochernes scorpioides]|uniref:Uncharacterized protein n=1 Tax=Cordylochernes scorpioides TaxID=51811 RepID=A0ABY6K275_9ARAC|nr:hypothetical protein LAZ67_2001091 [Cordylochernes scorpioides]
MVAGCFGTSEDERHPRQPGERDETGTAGQPFVSHPISNCLNSPEVLTDGPQWSPLGMSLVSQVTGLYQPVSIWIYPTWLNRWIFAVPYLAKSLDISSTLPGYIAGYSQYPTCLHRWIFAVPYLATSLNIRSTLPGYISEYSQYPTWLHRWIFAVSYLSTSLDISSTLPVYIAGY